MKKLLLTFMILLVSTDAFAGGGGGPLGFWDYAFPFINFFLLFGGLGFLLRKMIKEKFQNRSNTIQEGVAEAKKFYDEAFRKYEEIDCKLKNSDVEGKELLETLKQSADVEKRQMIESAKAFADQLQKDTDRMIEQEIKRAGVLLKAETVKWAAEAAEQTIKQKLDDNAQNTMNQEFISQVKGMGQESRA